MEKLFEDSETYTVHRPKKITDEQRANYYEEIAQEIIDSGWSNSDISVIISDLAKIGENDNGYEAAKQLESHYCRGSYHISSMMVEFLDCFNDGLEDILRENVADWVKAHNIQPKLKKQTLLKITKTINRHTPELLEGSEIYITGYNEKQAYYSVSPDPNKNGGYCVDYEIVEEQTELVSK